MRLTMGVTDGLKPDGQTTMVGRLPTSIRVSPHLMILLKKKLYLRKFVYTYI